MTIAEFVTKWQNAALTERAAAQEHFLDLCATMNVPTPAQEDPTGQFYTFEKSVTKLGGGQGFADVWKKGFFAWEYKGKKKDLNAAYVQIAAYHEDLGNPPLLVVCDLNLFEIHLKVTNVSAFVYKFDLAALLANEPTPTCPIKPLDVLRGVFTDPRTLYPAQSAEQVTLEVAGEFGKIARSLAARGHEPPIIARFLIRVLFCLFAEDGGLLKEGLFTESIASFRNSPTYFSQSLAGLFRAMATGGPFGQTLIKRFNGGLFPADATENDVLELTGPDLATLLLVARKDWRRIEPSIFGTLFERSLDPAKRSQLGAHYTGRSDIEAVVEPVLLPPLRRRWAQVQQLADVVLLRKRRLQGQQTPNLTPAEQRNLNRDLAATDAELTALLQSFTDELAKVTILDPACGSGNFLYVALRYLLDLENEVIRFAARSGLMGFFPKVGPEQMRGIEINEYAQELAPVTIWIGYIQWMRDNGFGQFEEPILRRMDMVRHQDALLNVAPDGSAMEAVWPAADIIIGNPPFLGGSKLRRELGDAYAEHLWRVYAGRVPGGADFVCYWFEKARALVASGDVKRVGLLSTNSIRGGANRTILERVKQSGDIFMAYSDREWVLDGAAVRISMVGFDNGAETEKTLDGLPAIVINPDLTGALNLTAAKPLRENRGICFRTDEKGGPFDIEAAIALKMLSAPTNVNGRPNSDVVRPYYNGLDIVRRPRNVWVIDFGIGMTEADAQCYEMPYEYVRQHVKPEREKVRTEREQQYWWLHRRPAPDMRIAVKHLTRFVVTPKVAKHRVFAWLSGEVIPDCQLYAFARDDDYFFGVLHSKAHELWALRMGTALEDRPRYTPTTTFETFPFPFPPGKEPAGTSTLNTQNSALTSAIADAARKLVALRDNWLNPPDATPAVLKTRTLTNLYNARPSWLDSAHCALDSAVFATYGWPESPSALPDDEILSRLLALNAERAALTPLPPLPSEWERGQGGEDGAGLGSANRNLG